MYKKNAIIISEAFVELLYDLHSYHKSDELFMEKEKEKISYETTNRIQLIEQNKILNFVRSRLYCNISEHPQKRQIKDLTAIDICSFAKYYTGINIIIVGNLDRSQINQIICLYENIHNNLESNYKFKCSDINKVQGTIDGQYFRAKLIPPPTDLTEQIYSAMCINFIRQYAKINNCNITFLQKENKLAPLLLNTVSERKNDYFKHIIVNFKREKNFIETFHKNFIYSFMLKLDDTENLAMWVIKNVYFYNVLYEVHEITKLYDTFNYLRFESLHKEMLTFLCEN